MATPCGCEQTAEMCVCEVIAGPGIDVTGSGTALTPWVISSEAAQPWTPYTPTTANFTLGNGLNGSRYLLNGKTIDLEVIFSFGTTSTFGASEWQIGFPAGITPYIDPSFLNIGTTIGFASMFDSSSASPWFEGDVFMRSTGLPLRVRFGDDAGGISDTSTVRNTIPFTWANGDRLALKLRVEVL